MPLHAKSAERESLFFPAVFATEDVAGIYNIIYRYLFDRRRDLGIPACFLLDRQGMLVKVYQGPVSAARVAEDVRTAPTLAADRSDRALPFKGELFQGRSSATRLPTASPCSSTAISSRRPRRFRKSSLQDLTTRKPITTWNTEPSHQ